MTLAQAMAAARRGRVAAPPQPAPRPRPRPVFRPVIRGRLTPNAPYTAPGTRRRIVQTPNAGAVGAQIRDQGASLTGAVRGITGNPIVRGGLDVIGSTFGDPGLGEQVAQVASIVTSAIDVIGGAFSDEGYTPEQVARNMALHAGNLDNAAKYEIRTPAGVVLPRGRPGQPQVLAP